MELTKRDLKALIAEQLKEVIAPGRETASDSYMARLKSRGREFERQDKYGDIEPGRKREMPSANTDEEIINAWRNDAAQLGLNPGLAEEISELNDAQILALNKYWESQTGQKMPLLDRYTGEIPAGGAPFPFSRDGGSTMDPNQIRVILKAIAMVSEPIRESNMKLTKQRLKDLILETLYEGDDDPEENLYDDEGLEGDKFVPDMHAASRGGDLDSDDGPVGMADTMHAKRIISKELMNIKSALRVDDFADARASLRKVNVFMKNIDKDDFPGARMSESVRTVSKEKLYKLIKEEMQAVMEQRPSMPNIPDDAFDFPEDDEGYGGEKAPEICKNKPVDDKEALTMAQAALDELNRTNDMDAATKHCVDTINSLPSGKHDIRFFNGKSVII